MALDKLVDSSQLDTDLTSVANAIRTKAGTSGDLSFPNGFVSAINDIPSGSTITESIWMEAPEPTDDSVHIWICLTPDMPSFAVKVNVGGKKSIDWGDGTDPESSTTDNTSHTYSSNGVYEIVVSASSGSLTIPHNNMLASVTGSNVTRRLIRRCYIPSGITGVGQYKLQNCYALEKATVKASGSLGMYAFYYCYSLREINLAEGITDCGTSCFASTSTLLKITLPSTITTIGNSSFNYCGALEYHFKSTTPPTINSTNVFGNTQSSKVIYVPYSADHSILEAYTTATNWSTYASFLQEEPQ